ncbi:NAD(P)/FAD-dependent oxidoreductase [Brachybacterium saurashtrense]|uniref:NAD(P)/FAD-dependent oxidoreductase n=1 Tax=Brachybacterium saurashtrense TaxID=556288 RepID=A0A345YSU5_9MICO|nr:NAD(P)/FAD-dependent oxidoreductase [Brachybacterium saurashtrense]AXK46997.1 NAD(P)/FAD-dependent oxidoreductase [Brachybacterium saurashtrense]RRR22712.1 NAD(P)/FAD-dependent oxidoreductase [Brachybacterium saurashtrense]
MTRTETTAPTAEPAAGDPLPETLVDVAVLGGGAAGLSGALMLARSRRSVVVLDAGTPRNAPAAAIHALLGHDGTPPAEYLACGRAEVRRYGGRIVPAQVVSARAARPAPDGDLRFALDLADGRTLTARRLLVAVGVRDELPGIPGLARHWGRDLVHCPFCHGWEVRDRAIGVLATTAMSAHQALMFRELTEDLHVFAAGAELDPASRERFAALGITVHEGAVEEVLAGEDGGIAGVRLAGGEIVPRSVLAVATTLTPRLDGLEGLGLALEELPGGMGWKVPTGMAGASEVPGVWVAGNAADPAAQVGAAAAGGALAGGHLHGALTLAGADAAVAAARASRTA